MPIHPYRLCVHSHKQLNRLILQNSQTRFVRAILEIYIILSRQRYVQHNTHTSSERYRHSRIWCINVIKLYKAMDFVWFAPVDQTAIFERRRRLRRWRHWNSISSARLAAAAKFIHNRFPDLLSSFDCENCVYFFFAALLAVGCAFLCGHICIECNVHSSQRWNMPGYLWFWCSVCVCVRLSIAECSCSRKIENDNWTGPKDTEFAGRLCHEQLLWATNELYHSYEWVNEHSNVYWCWKYDLWFQCLIEWCNRWASGSIWAQAWGA